MFAGAAPRVWRIILTACCIMSAGCGATKPVKTFEHGPGQVVAAAFSADGALLAAAGEDRTVRVWDVGSGRRLAKIDAPTMLPPRTMRLRGVAFSPDGHTVAFAGEGGEVFLWHWRERLPPRLLFTLDHPARDIAFTLDGTHVTAIAGGLPAEAPGSRPAAGPTPLLPVHLASVRLESNTIVSEIRLPDCGALSVALSESGSRAAVSCLRRADGTPVHSLSAAQDIRADLLVFAMPEGTRIAFLEGAGHVLLEPSSDDRHILAGESVWDAQTGELVRHVPIDARAFIDDSRRVLVLEQGTGVPWELLAATRWMRPVRIDLRTGRRLTGRRMVFGHFSTSPGITLSPAFTPDRRHFVDHDLNLWRLPL